MAVMPGEMVSIVGPSGSGKSTLLYCLSGLESPTSGAISVMGHDLGALTRSQLATLRRDHIGFVFQSFNLIPSLSARQNVSLPARLAKRGLNDERIERALADVGMSAHARKRPGELSGGQQQRIAIARVLAAQPDIVFADEPTGSLDTANGAEALRLLRRVTTATSALVLVTHDLEAAALADRVLVMRDRTIHRELVSPTADARYQLAYSTAAITPLLVGVSLSAGLYTAAATLNDAFKIHGTGGTAALHANEVALLLGGPLLLAAVASAIVVFMSSRTRGQELALLQASGATHRTIMRTATLEAVIYVITAGILASAIIVASGVIIAAGLSTAAPGTTAKIDAMPGLIIAGVGCVLIMFATLGPTIVGLRRDVIRTLSSK